MSLSPDWPAHLPGYGLTTDCALDLAERYPGDFETTTVAAILQAPITSEPPAPPKQQNPLAAEEEEFEGVATDTDDDEDETGNAFEETLVQVTAASREGVHVAIGPYSASQHTAFPSPPEHGLLALYTPDSAQGTKALAAARSVAAAQGKRVTVRCRSKQSGWRDARRCAISAATPAPPPPPPPVKPPVRRDPVTMALLLPSLKRLCLCHGLSWLQLQRIRGVLEPEEYSAGKQVVRRGGFCVPLPRLCAPSVCPL